tara:strand:+ start:5994 stop:6218 length:225 start_codon:yes stop_codon:yes gene_type:complete
MSDHTRGPWMPSDINDGLLPRNEADVILMAAAPDLLSALKEMLEHFESKEADEDEAVLGHARRIYIEATDKGGE